MPSIRSIVQAAQNISATGSVVYNQGKTFLEFAGDSIGSADGAEQILLNDLFGGDFQSYIANAKENLDGIRQINNRVISDMQDRYDNNKNATWMAWQWILSPDDIISEMNKRNLQVSAHINEDRVHEVSQKINQEMETLDRLLAAVNTTAEHMKSQDTSEAGKFNLAN